jgi:hypothetical protein
MLFFGIANPSEKAPLRTEIQNMLNTMNPEDKKEFLTRIANLKNAIKNKENLSVTETLSK